MTEGHGLQIVHLVRGEDGTGWSLGLSGQSIMDTRWSTEGSLVVGGGGRTTQYAVGTS